MKIIGIKKAKLTGKSTIETTYIDGSGNEITFKGESTAHPQLKDAFKGLVKYFADYTEQKEASSIRTFDTLDDLDGEIYDKIQVTGVSIGSGSNGQTVTISGSRTLDDKSVLNFNTPKIDLDPTSNPWPLVVPFENAVMRVMAEVEEYITRSHSMAERAETDTDTDVVIGGDNPFEE